MRDLTTEELKLAPEWATHYYLYSDGDILFECNIMYQYYDTKKKEFHDPLNCSHVSDESVEIKRKPFDITQHEWSDKMANLGAMVSERGDVVIRVGSSWIFFDKSDGIAIAKALGLTSEDLK